MSSFQGSRVLVVGGSSGIGLATAAAFLAAGAHVTIASRSVDKLQAAARSLAMFDETAKRLPVGRVGQPEDIAQAVLYLAGNTFATGTVLLCEGGAVLV